MEAYGFEMEDCDPKTLHEISDGIESSHSDVEKTSDDLFPLD